MSILIKGMAMPETCGDCLFYGLESAGNGMYYDFCRCKNCILYNDVDETTYDDCPLVEVKTPHGRLIDADAYCDKMGKRQEAAHTWMYEATMNANDEGYDRAEATCCAFIESKLTLDNMPTIIESEEG